MSQTMVAPFAGAWIEILINNASPTITTARRSLRGGVD